MADRLIGHASEPVDDIALLVIAWTRPGDTERKTSFRGIRRRATGYPAAMNTTLAQTAAAAAGAGMTVIVVLGVLITVMLVWAVRLGIGVRRREPVPPRPAEQPTPPASGPVHEEREAREPNEVPRAGDGGERLDPHQLGGGPSRRSADQSRPRFDDTP
ncbi:DUF6479 family protein [Streptomyces antibioticus]|uniref:DUF6479 family protein n=1 Tax=Streptomyces antibioticus TaxID=1890 RepID=UPI00368D8351